MTWYVTADTHLRHKLMLEKRGVDYEAKIYGGISAVKADNRAVFIHLGDVVIGGAVKERSEHAKLLSAVKERGFSRSALVKGNHETRSNGWYLDAGWDWVCDAFELDVLGYTVIFTHKPLQREMVEKEVNLHGHIHNPDHRASEFVLSNRHYLVSLELNNYTLESLKKILRKIKL